MTAFTTDAQKLDLVLFVQQFEQDFAQAAQLLRKSHTLSPTEAGNISLRIPGEDRIVISALNGPHPGVGAVVDFDLRTEQGRLTGNLKEVAALHIAILRERPAANAVIHTHSHYLTAFSIARRPLPVYSSSLLGALREDEEIPVTAWGPRYAPAPVVDTLRAHPDAPAALLANHGPFAWSSGGVLAVARLLVGLEDAAHLTFLAEQLGGAKRLPEGAAESARKGWNAP